MSRMKSMSDLSKQLDTSLTQVGCNEASFTLADLFLKIPKSTGTEATALKNYLVFFSQNKL